MVAYYNEYDAYCAQWLRNLISSGHIPDGDVDERSITEVKADEIKKYDQWHFFAGLGGWGYAARLAGIGETSGILTGSPPCQPFSNAGKRQGYADERHLAPVWLDLVAALRPAWVFGEQVSAAIKKDDWLDDLLDALEREGYATGSIVLPACSVGAPHIRQRLWVVARLGDGEQPRLEGHRRDGDQGQGRSEQAGSVAETGKSGGVEISGNSGTGHQCREVGEQRWDALDGRSTCLRQEDRAFVPDGSHANGEPGGVGNAKRGRPQGWNQPEGRSKATWKGQRNSGLADTEDRNGWAGQYNDEAERQQGYGKPSGHNRNIGLADSESCGQQGERLRSNGKSTQRTAKNGTPCQRPGPTQTGWDDPDWLYCRDGKWRPVESGTFPLADGIPARVGRLRAYGNAIVPQVAEEIIKEIMLGNDQ